MTITYSWKVKGVKGKNVNGMENVIVQTYWEKTGTDENGNTGTFSGATPFHESDVSPETFIEFENLTEETVLNWIKSVVVGSYEEHVNKQIQKQIDEKINAISDVDMPWAPTSAQSPDSSV